MFSMGSSNSRGPCHKLQHSGAIIKTIGKWREKTTFDFSYHLNFWCPHLQESIWHPYKSFPTVTQRAVVGAGWSIQRMCLFCSLLHRDQSSPGRTWLEVRASSDSFLQPHLEGVCRPCGAVSYVSNGQKPTCQEINFYKSMCWQMWYKLSAVTCSSLLALPKAFSYRRRQVRAVFET